MVQKQVNKTPTDMAKIAQKCELSKNANLFVTIVLRATAVWMGDAPMGRLYFVAPHSKKKSLFKPLRMSATTSGGVLAGRTIAGACSRFFLVSSFCPHRKKKILEYGNYMFLCCCMLSFVVLCCLIISRELP